MVEPRGIEPLTSAVRLRRMLHEISDSRIPAPLCRGPENRLQASPKLLNNINVFFC
jgi:hypothetical protein